MLFRTLGNEGRPAILFFHAMGVTGDSSSPVAERLKSRYYCILPTSTVYCRNQIYRSKADEVQQIERFLCQRKIDRLEMVVASSIGADLAMAFLTQTKIHVSHVFFDGGQFAQIKPVVRRIMVPFLFVAIKSLYWSKGKTLKYILWCEDQAIKPYFVEAGKNLNYKNLKRQLEESLEDRPLPQMPAELQRRSFWEFGSKEDHYKYRRNVMEAYQYGNFPVFDGFQHMQYQIRNPRGFAEMLITVMEENQLPQLPFLQEKET